MPHRPRCVLADLAPLPTSQVRMMNVITASTTTLRVVTMAAPPANGTGEIKKAIAQR